MLVKVGEKETVMEATYTTRNLVYVTVKKPQSNLDCVIERISNTFSKEKSLSNGFIQLNCTVDMDIRSVSSVL